MMVMFQNRRSTYENKVVTFVGKTNQAKQTSWEIEEEREAWKRAIFEGWNIHEDHLNLSVRPSRKECP